MNKDNCLERQNVSGEAPNNGDVLTFDTSNPAIGGQWRPRPLGANPDGAIGLDFVFQPTPAPTPDSNNIFHTEATLKAAMTALMLVTLGPIGLAIDSSLAAATFTNPAPFDCQGRVELTAARNQLGAAATLTIADGASLLNLRHVDESVTLVFTCATAPALAFTGVANFSVDRLATLKNIGAVAAIQPGAGTTLLFSARGGAILQMTGAGSMIQLQAGVTLQTELFEKTTPLNAGFTPSNNFVSGAAGAWFEVHDASIVLPTQINFVPGAVTTLADVSKQVAYDVAAQPNLAATLALQQIVTAQAAIGMKMSAVRQVAGGAFTFDTPNLDQAISSTVIGSNGTIPAGFPIGRELTIADATGTNGATLFTFTPAAGERVNGAALGVPFVVTDTIGRAITIKKTSATDWTVMSGFADSSVPITQEVLASGNVTVPVGMTTAVLSGCGGGGGGGGGITGAAGVLSASPGGGGAALLQDQVVLGLVPGAVIPVVIGAGGLGGAAGAATGADGGLGTPTTFNGAGVASLVGASGGQGAQLLANEGIGGAAQPNAAGTANQFDYTQSAATVAGLTGVGATPCIPASGGKGGGTGRPAQSGAMNGGRFVGGAPGASFAAAGQGGGGGAAGPYGVGGAGGAGAAAGVGTAGAAGGNNTGAGGGGGGSGGGVGNVGAAGGAGGSGRLRITWLP